MESIYSLADVNNHYRKADLEAIRFLETQQCLDRLKETSEKHLAKYFHVFRQRLLRSLPPILAIPGHLAAGAVEGLTLAPLFKSMMKGPIAHPTLLEAASYMPIAIFWAMTLMVGHSLHRVNLHKDALNPQRLIANWPELAKGIVFGIGYVYCLVVFTHAAEARLFDTKQPAVVIFWVGLFELLLGYFSISGWEALYAHGLSFWYKKQKNACSASIYFRAHRCEQYYTYYEQSLRHFNLVEGTNYPSRINARIEQALAFGQSTCRPKETEAVTLSDRLSMN